MKAVLTFRRNVKSRIEALNEAITMYGVHLLRPLTPLPMTTGKSGKMQGASTVSAPAKIAMSKKVSDILELAGELCEGVCTAGECFDQVAVAVDFYYSVLADDAVLFL